MTQEEHNRISAWLDGELPEAEWLAFERAMADDPDLAETVARWQANDAALRAAFDQSVDRPVDDAFLARLGLSSAPVEEFSERSNIVSLAAERAARQAAANASTPPRPVARPLWRWVGGGALAASLALVATLSLRPGPDVTGGAGADAAFQTALDRTPSGTQVALLPQGALTPILSFAAASGQWCREYRVDGPAARSGVACREAGGWRVQGEVRGASAQSSGAQSGGDAGRIVTAGGADNRSLDAIYRRLDAGDPIDSDAENHMIANGWGAKAPAPSASQSARPAQ